MRIVPIALTRPDWKQFIALCQEQLGFSPTRGLDNDKLDLKSEAAYLGCLALDNMPIRNLREGYLRNGTFDHVFFTCGTNIESRTIYNIMSYTPAIRLLFKDKVTLLTGSIADWFRAIRIGCSEDVTKDVRDFYNELFIIFNNSSFAEIFNTLTKTTLPDNTFILEEI